ncbi:MAG TPA: hypothetical protein P5330_01855 [Candidatus Competibacteraceae bacterium]|nr:hypothetical protein [Candidatus Competibacteraceae bacterium]
MKRLQQDRMYPAYLLDNNLTMRRNRMRYVAHLPQGETLLPKR